MSFSNLHYNESRSAHDKEVDRQNKLTICVAASKNETDIDGRAKQMNGEWERTTRNEQSITHCV